MTFSWDTWCDRSGPLLPSCGDDLDAGDSMHSDQQEKQEVSDRNTNFTAVNHNDFITGNTVMRGMNIVEE